MNKYDLISREAAIECAINAIDDWDGGWNPTREEVIKKYFTEIPTVDAIPVRHGRWIDENPDDFLDPRLKCSICAEIESPLIKWRYCPNCGAKMDG